MFLEELLNEQERIIEILSKAREDIEKSPEGTLRITRSKSNPRYYHRKNSADRTGSFIKAKDMNLAKKLAQKRYAEDVIHELEQKEELIDAIINSYNDSNIPSIFRSYNEARQKLITPYELDDEEFAAKWIQETTEQLEAYKQSEDYQTNNHEENLIFTTAKGETVRSKSEVIIADTLLRLGIHYQYELPYVYQGKTMFNPDFTVLNVRKRECVYIEHFGKMASEGYRESFFWKMRNFEKIGIVQGKNLIMTFEDADHQFNIKDYIKAISEMCR